MDWHSVHYISSKGLYFSLVTGFHLLAKVLMWGRKFAKELQIRKPVDTTVGGSPLGNPYFRAKPKLSVFENEQFSGQNFQTNVKCYGEKVLEIFLTLKKKFFSGHFFSKKIQKKFGKFFKGEKFFKMFFYIFFKKSVLKKNVFWVSKKFPKLFPITFYIFLNIFGPKKSVR